MRARLAVYDIQACGYYASNGDPPLCGGLSGCLRHICTWILDHKPRLDSTKTFEALPNGAGLPVYCFDCAQSGTNDFLITTWNETPADAGNIGSVRKASTAGDAVAQTTGLPQDSIAGYPTHFWFMADVWRLVTVRFDSQPLNGHLGVSRFIQGYLERLSPHVRFADSTIDRNIFKRDIAGYAIDVAEDEGDDSVIPRFRSCMHRIQARLDYIRTNRNAITKVIRKGRPSAGAQPTRRLIDQALKLVGATPGNRALPDTNFTFTIPYNPTAKELEAIIKGWQDQPHETWDDIGFDFGSQNTRRWLSGATLLSEIDVPDDLHRVDGNVARASPLLEALMPHRSKVSA